MGDCMGEQHLFDELRIGSLLARNRFVRAATYEGAADTEGQYHVRGHAHLPRACSRRCGHHHHELCVRA